MKKTIIQIILIIILLCFIVMGIIYLAKDDKRAELESEYDELKQESNMYNESASVEELKEEYNYEGSSELYEIQTEYDGRKVLVVKANANFKVAFAGLIKNSKYEYEEAVEIFETDYPKQNGIWIEEKSREKILEFLNTNLKSKYDINEAGYLIITDYKKSNNDEIINEKINGEKQYIIGISGIMYYIDSLTGDVSENPFEELDDAQTYSYVEDDNKMLICIPENEDNHLTNSEIFESIIELVK